MSRQDRLYSESTQGKQKYHKRDICISMTASTDYSLQSSLDKKNDPQDTQLFLVFTDNISFC